MQNSSARQLGAIGIAASRAVAVIQKPRAELYYL
jgi:hypothetical protein